MVAPAIAAAAIGAGASLLGGALSNREARKNRQMQREFAEQGIRMRVADAKAAGVHPVYALGANTPSYSPVVSAMPQAVSDAGQSIARAVDAAGSTEDRLLARQLAQVNLRNAQLQGDYIQEQIAASQAARLAQESRQSVGVPGGGVQVFPVDPFPGNRIESRDLVQVKPNEVVSARSSNEGITAGYTPGFDSFSDERGGRYLGLSEKLSQATEDMGLLRYYLTARANYPWIGDAEDAVRSFFAPDWVERVERSTGKKLRPVRIDGRLFWQETDKPSRAPRYFQKRSASTPVVPSFRR